ncbi:MAG: hypothetical protein HC796_08740 [Synechococcaceae cyanobacterium RL_1_2]|nr:hypothetical protein [Synechococcaceae cyanobacterium RL_1_2]
MKLISFVSLVVFGVGVYGIPDAIGQTQPVETVAPQGDTPQLQQLGQTLNSSYNAFNQSLNQTFQDLNNWLDNQDQLAIENLNLSYSQLQTLIETNELLKESLKNRP